ncbi:N-terminal acetyltransferase [Asimina triloba]
MKHYPGLPALHCDAGNRCHDRHHPCSKDGRALLSCFSHVEFSEQGDKARVIQTLLFMSGINTLLQTFIGTRLPTVMNSSFAFLIPVISVTDDFALRPFTTEHERFLHTMRAIQGALIVSSFLNIIIGYSKIWGKYSR